MMFLRDNLAGGCGSTNSSLEVSFPDMYSFGEQRYVEGSLNVAAFPERSLPACGGADETRAAEKAPYYVEPSLLRVVDRSFFAASFDEKKRLLQCPGSRGKFDIDTLPVVEYGDRLPWEAFLFTPGPSEVYRIDYEVTAHLPTEPLSSGDAAHAFRWIVESDMACIGPEWIRIREGPHARRAVQSDVVDAAVR